jgi:hypothetical protein
MSRVGFEPTIPLFKRTKTVRAVDRPTTVIGSPGIEVIKLQKVGWVGHVALMNDAGNAYEIGKWEGTRLRC